MAENLDALVKNIEKGTASYYNMDLFVDRSDKELIVACKEFLKCAGYRIIDPIDDKINVSTTKDLVDLFYDLKKHSHPEKCSVYRNMVLDLRSVKLFVEARMAAGNIIKKQALKECALIIRTLFVHEKEFKFKYPITLTSLGQKKAGWITEKALEIINKNLYNKREREAEDLRQAVLDKQLMDKSDFDDFDDVFKDIEKEK